MKAERSPTGDHSSLLLFLSRQCFQLLPNRMIVSGAENIPRAGTALILSKHRANADIPHLGMALYQNVQRYAMYAMKSSLIPRWFFEKIGGVPLHRKMDIQRTQKRYRDREFISKAQKHNEDSFTRLMSFYRCGELVVSFPEGTVYPYSLGKLRTGVIRHACEVEKHHNIIIPLIPVGIYYEAKHFSMLYAHVHIKIGQPIYTRECTSFQELMQQLAAMLKWLSEPNINR